MNEDINSTFNNKDFLKRKKKNEVTKNEKKLMKNIRKTLKGIFKIIKLKTKFILKLFYRYIIIGQLVVVITFHVLKMMPTKPF